ncbi:MULTISPECIES: glycosyltransferase [Bacillus]|uniref:glycosyltransferase n=1 Tax=Bacillus TaxID=1386 RepID=UPI000BEC1F27|nr:MULTISPECIES: glycosyltransferase [Bacillus]PEF91602.1 hypothetical protein CON46_18260 [Bacillus cereus]PFQ22690.1 hypothetical protein COK16_24100 [Bacillus cereus]PFT11232.1 hypothetical protein COK59_04155 [Bacillus thuringiensis]PGR75000.1 hypothetical protein COC63_24920 [Bacillus cereus]
MNKILFITTRNVLNTCGELRLIKNRAKALYEKWNITTDFIVICDEKKIRSRNEEIGNNSRVIPISCNQHNPISVYSAFKKSKRLLMELIKTENYKCVILSGIGTFSFAPIIKKNRKDLPIIADIHGAKEELLEFNSGNMIQKTYKSFLYNYVKNSERKYLHQLDGSLVVSNALADYLDKEYNLKNFKHYVVPCAIENKRNDPEIKLINREKYRKKYNVKADEVLFIYSGGFSPWQCINESIKTFSNIKSKSNAKVKLLILSHQIEKISPMIKGYSEIITDSVNAQDVEKVLCAGDYAFLIRKDFITNNVAYPNKFLEYVQSGMKIITTPFVFDVANQVKEFNLGISIDINSECDEQIIEYINDSNNKKQLNHRAEELLSKISFDETLVDFIKQYKLDK